MLSNRTASIRRGRITRGKWAKSLLFPLFITALALWAGGCASYQPGRQAEPPFRTLHLAPVVNESFAPQAQALLTNQIAEHFLRDGTVRLAGEDLADATLQVKLVDFRQTTAATRPDDTGLAGQLRLELAAECTLTDNRTGKVYFENRPVGTEIRIVPGQTAQEAQYVEMPVLTRGLARRIGHEVLQVW